MERKKQRPDPPVAAGNHPADFPDRIARVLNIYISAGHDYWGKNGEGRLQNGVKEMTEIECVAGMGLKGDRYFGHKPDYPGQVTFFENTIVEEVRTRFRLFKLPASVFRRNVIVSGLDLCSLKGKRFAIQGVLFEGTEECTPCFWMDRAIAPGVEDFLKDNFRGGLRARILRGGMLRTG